MLGMCVGYRGSLPPLFMESQICQGSQLAPPGTEFLLSPVALFLSTQRDSVSCSVARRDVWQELLV